MHPRTPVFETGIEGARARVEATRRRGADALNASGVRGGSACGYDCAVFGAGALITRMIRAETRHMAPEIRNAVM
jgi:hypothetical protein